MTELASTHFMSNADLLNLLIPYLDIPIYPLLFVNKGFAAAILPRLYRTLSIDFDTSDITPFFVSPSSDSYPPPWSKAYALRHCQTLRIYNHGSEQCAKLDFPSLPNLSHLDLPGGDTHPSMRPLCEPMDCLILRNYAHQFTTLTIRKLSALPPFPSVQSATMRLRPCALPRTHFSASQDCISTIQPLSKAATIDIVWWDENHDTSTGEVYHLPPWVPPRPPDKPVFWRGGQARDITLDCNYCDQFGCVRYSPNSSKQLPALMYEIGRYTDAKRVRVWNSDETIGIWQWYDSKMSIKDVKVEMQTAFNRGRRERGSGVDYVELVFRDAGDYVSAIGKGQVDLSTDVWEVEREYWEKKVKEPPYEQDSSVQLSDDEGDSD